MGSSFTDNDNLLFPIRTTFTGAPLATSGASYVSASNIDTKGLDVTTAAGDFLIYGFYAPNSTDVTPGIADFLRADLALAFPRFEAFLRVALRFFALAMVVSCEVCRRQVNKPDL